MGDQVQKTFSVSPFNWLVPHAPSRMIHLIRVLIKIFLSLSLSPFNLCLFKMANAAELPIEGALSQVTINKLCQFCRNVEHPSNELCCPNCDIAEFSDDDDDEGDSDSDTVIFEGGLGGVVSHSTPSNNQVHPLFRLLSPTYSRAYMAAECASLLPEWNPRPKSAPAPGDWMFFMDPHYERGLMMEREERMKLIAQSKPFN